MSVESRKSHFGTPILVTGGNGAVGRFVVEDLNRRDYSVCVLSRQQQPSARKGSARHFATDIRDVDAVTVALSDCGARHVIHLAAALLDSEANPHLGFSVNSGGAAALFEAARRTGVERVVYASTKAVFGPLEGNWGHPHYRPVRENHTRRPTSMYGLSKRLAEDLASWYSDRFGLDIIIVRFATTCGPGKGPQHGASAIISTLIENAARGEATMISQGAEQRDDILYNRDVARGLVLACLALNPDHNVYHLGSGRLTSLTEIAFAVRAEIPDACIEVGPGLDYMGLGLGNYCRMSTARAERELEFRAHWPLAEWVRDYIALVRDGA